MLFLGIAWLVFDKKPAINAVAIQTLSTDVFTHGCLLVVLCAEDHLYGPLRTDDGNTQIMSHHKWNQLFKYISIVNPIKRKSKKKKRESLSGSKPIN